MKDEKSENVINMYPGYLKPKNTKLESLREKLNVQKITIIDPDNEYTNNKDTK